MRGDVEMGFWDTSLFGNDTTADIRDSYIEYLKDQLSDEDAYKKLLSEYQEVLESDEEPLFWYALAHTQWKTGRLTSEVKEKALYFIEQNGCVEFFEEEYPGKNNPWIKTLQKLKTILESEMKPYKRFRKPIPFKTNPWNVGDVYAYQFHSDLAKKCKIDGKYILFHKIGDVECGYIRKLSWYTSVIVYNQIFDEIPGLEAIKDLQPLPHMLCDRPLDSLNDCFPSLIFYQVAIMIRESRVSFPEKHMTFIGNAESGYEEYYDEGNTCFWDKDRMEDYLVRFALSWKNIKY